MRARHGVTQADATDPDEGPVLEAHRVVVGRALLTEGGTGIGVAGVRRRPIVDRDIVVAAGQHVVVPAEHIVHRLAPARDRHGGEIETLPTEVGGQAPGPLGERAPQHDTVCGVDLAVIVLIHDTDVPGLRLVPLHLHGVGDLPDAAELVVVVDRNGVADEPFVPDIVLVGAVQTDDAVAVQGPVDLRAPADAVPVAEDLRIEGHLDAAIQSRADVLQNARAAVDAGQLPVHQEVARRGSVHVHGARDAAPLPRELEPAIRLAGPLPREIVVRQAPRPVADCRLVAEGVDRSRERSLRLIRIDRRVSRLSVADAELQVGEETAVLDEAFLGEAPGERGRGKHLALVPRRQARRTVFAAGEREEVAVLERVVQPGHVGFQGPPRQVAGRRVHSRRRPQVEVPVLLVWQREHWCDLVFSPLRLDAVHERGVDAVRKAQAALERHDVIERVRQRALLLEGRVGGAPLQRLRLGTPELPAAIERQVRPEVHPPVERGGQVVVGEQGAERARAAAVILLVLDV